MKRSITNNFLHRVRIHGGEFDASARAMHRKAALENVSSATIERTIMSTKTTLKRISLVAVAAMGFGLLSVVPSSAVSQSDTLTVSAATSSMVAGGAAATTTVTQSFLGQSSDSMSVTASLVSSPAGNAVLPVLSVGSGSVNTTPAIVSPGLVANVNANAAGYTSTTGVLTASLSATVAGTYVVKFTPAVVLGGGTVQAVAVTWTVTVTGAGTSTAANSTSFLNTGETTAATVDAVVSASLTLAATAQAASIVVTPKNAAGTDLTSTEILSATISGPGSLGISNVAGVISQIALGRAITGTAGQNVIGVFSDGTSGVATITISVGTTVLATETVTFYGAIASIVATTVNAAVAVGSTGSNVGAITAVAKDANGTVVPTGTLYANSDTVGVISNAYSAATIISGVATFTLVGVAAGTANITIGNGSTAALTTVSAAASAIRVGSSTPATVTVTFDKATYLLGEAAVVTVSLKDAAGLAVPNATYANIFAAGGLVSNFGLTGASIAVTSITTAGSTGAQTFAVSMPAYATDVVLSATGGTGLPTAAQVALTSTTAKVTNPSNDAATAAANEATDAANAATDAANYAADAADAATTAAEEATAAAVAAQESADAAMAAVVALSLRLNVVYNALRSQVISLTNLIVRITKKLKA